MIIILLDGEFPLRIKITKKHPVDLYALMDLSRSMEKHKDNLEKAADNIANTISKKATDYRLGFGSFVDKPTPPFSRNQFQNLECQHYDATIYDIINQVAFPILYLPVES